MRDDEWQAAYNAGRESAAGLVEALEVIVALCSDGKPHGSSPFSIARTALEKYREGK